MNYVTLNGVRSTTIQGLLIQSLPPISKPLIRTQVEEIDGRDGDIITKLGYSAYDKEISVGLHGDFDINQVIAFFDSEGTVIFSNEPDKYYNYQIIEQIDFERLIRFRTATVKFHVQPFKYSAVEQGLTFTNQYLSIPDYSATKNGITLSVQGGTIAVSGTGASGATEFYLPVNALSLNTGMYELAAFASGTGAEACSMRLIDTTPADAQSFGGTYVALQNNNAVTLRQTTLGTKNYNYLWFYIAAGTAMNFSLTVDVMDYNRDFIYLTNSGNIYAKPQITIYGIGTVNLSVNGNQIFVINIGSNGFITIDSAQMEAYQSGVLMNRLVTGDYDNLVLPVGANTISWTGIVTEVVIDNYSRWI